jgi:hypothetical protein
MSPPRSPALAHWHRVVETRDPSLLADLLADDVVFHSPAVYAPQEGKEITTAYLTAALRVLGPSVRYTAEWSDESGAVLEFEAKLDDKLVHGVDILRWGVDDRLTSFTVMVRPVQGLQALMAHMARALAG